jgi:hypothetical protein
MQKHTGKKSICGILVMTAFVATHSTAIAAWPPKAEEGRGPGSPVRESQGRTRAEIRTQDLTALSQAETPADIERGARIAEGDPCTGPLHDESVWGAVSRLGCAFSRTVNHKSNSVDPGAKDNLGVAIANGGLFLEGMLTAAEKEIEAENDDSIINGTTISLPINVTLDLSDNISFVAKFSAQSAPSYVGGKHIRRDKWKFKLPIHIYENALEWVSDRLPVTFNVAVEPILEIEYMRQFDVKSDSMGLNTEGVLRWVPFLSNAKMPFSNFPFTAERLLKKMNPGDIVHFKGGISGFTGPSVQGNIADWMKAEANLALVSVFAGYDAYIFRGPDSLARVRLVGQRITGFGDARTSIGFDNSDDIIPFWLERPVNSAFGIGNLRKTSIEALGHNNLFMADYVLDLSDPDVAVAYDNMMKKFLKPTKYKELIRHPVAILLNPFKTQDDLFNRLVNEELLELDALAKKWATHPLEDGKFFGGRKVVREFSGDNEQRTTDVSDVYHGVKTVYSEREQRADSTNELRRREFVRGDNGTVTDVVRTYEYPYARSMENSKGILDEEIFLGSLTNNLERKTYSCDVIYATLEDEKREFRSFGCRVEIEEKTLRTNKWNNEWDEIVGDLAAWLPASKQADYAKFVSDNFPGPNRRRLHTSTDNVRIEGRFVFNGPAFTKLVKVISADGTRTKREMKTFVRHHLKAQLQVIDGQLSFFQRGISYLRDLLRLDFSSGESEMVDALATVADMNATKSGVVSNNQTKALEDLIANALYRRMGPNLIFAILESDGVAVTHDMFHVNLRFSNVVTGEPPVYNRGNGIHQPLYETIKTVQDVLDDVDAKDMRLPCRGDNDFCNGGKTGVDISTADQLTTARN